MLHRKLENKWAEIAKGNTASKAPWSPEEDVVLI